MPDAWTMRRLARNAKSAARRPGLFHALDQDVRYAMRSFRTGRSFTIAVIGSLAIGIAATTTGFALVKATFFRPFPGVQDEDDLVLVKIGRPGVWLSTTWNECELLKSGLTALEDVAASHSTNFAVTAGSGVPAESVACAVVSGN